ncbi:unnamed protein product [Aphanomyces euteiches]
MFKFALFSQHSPILPIQIFAFLAVIFTVATECLATPVYPAAIDQLKSSLSGSTFCVRKACQALFRQQSLVKLNSVNSKDAILRGGDVINTGGCEIDGELWNWQSLNEGMNLLWDEWHE